MISLSDPRMTVIMALISAPFDRYERNDDVWTAYSGDIRLTINPRHTVKIQKSDTHLLTGVLYPVEPEKSLPDDLFFATGRERLQKAFDSKALMENAILCEDIQYHGLLHGTDTNISFEGTPEGVVCQQFSVFRTSINPLFVLQKPLSSLGCFILDLSATTLVSHWNMGAVFLPKSQHERITLLHRLQEKRAP